MLAKAVLTVDVGNSESFTVTLKVSGDIGNWTLPYGLKLTGRFWSLIINEWRTLQSTGPETRRFHTG